MFNLRPYQQDATTKILEDLKTHKRLGCVCPTGSGKTEIIIKVSEEILKQHYNGCVLYLSHLSLLTDQTAARFKLRSPGLRVGIFQAKEMPDRNVQVIISTMQTSRVKDKVDLLKLRSIKDVKLIVVDEAHFLFTTSYDKVLEQFEGVPVLGFTATPYRSKAIMVNWFDKLSFTISLGELINQKFLVPPRLIQIEKRGKTVEEICEEVVSLYLEKEQGSKAIVYMRTIEDAKLLRNIFESKGVKSRAVTSKLVGDYRNDVLNTFTRGQTSVLTTCNVLTAGFDSPVIDCIIQPYATTSPTQYLQRIGRGLRLCPEKNKTECRVYVYGSAPSIASKLYEKLQQKALNQGRPPKEHDTYKEDWELNDYDRSSEIYVWNKRVVDIINRLDKIGLGRFAAILNEKRFPPKFMKDIQELMDALPLRKRSLPRGNELASSGQMTLLFKLGFASKDLSDLNRNEASAIISIIRRLKGIPNDVKYVVPSGLHAGKTIFELPYAYRTFVLKKFPNSPVAKMLREHMKGDQR